MWQLLRAGGNCAKSVVALMTGCPGVINQAPRLLGNLTTAAERDDTRDRTSITIRLGEQKTMEHSSCGQTAFYHISATVLSYALVINNQQYTALNPYSLLRALSVFWISSFISYVACDRSDEI